MATPTHCSSAAASTRLPPPLPPSSLAASPVLPCCLSRNFPILRVPTQRRGTFPYSSAAMASTSRFLILDDPDDPLDFGAIPGAAFLPLRRWAEKRKRAATPEVVKVRAAPPEVVEVRSDGDGSVEEEGEEVKTRPAKKGNFNSLAGKKSVKIIGNSDIHMDKKAVQIIENSNTHLDKKVVKIMTYNVWFREELQLKRRMNALGNLIWHHSPDLICFQEVTPNIYLLLKKI